MSNRAIRLALMAWMCITVTLSSGHARADLPVSPPACPPNSSCIPSLPPTPPGTCGPGNGGATCGGDGPATLGNGNGINVINGNKFQREVGMAPLPGTLGLEIGRGWKLSYETTLYPTGRIFGARQTMAAPLTLSDLSLTPPAPCKGAGRPAPKMKETIHAESVGMPSTSIDLNGDGWCDWILPTEYPTNPQLPDYGATEAILLGTPTGARTFGKMDKLKQYWKKKLPPIDGLVMPNGTTGMAPALVAYAGTSPVPYFAGLSSSYPAFWSDGGSYPVYRWNQEFDMPQRVSQQEYVTVMRFWQKQYCSQKRYTNQDFLHPDQKDAEHPLEIFVCAPWTVQSIDDMEKRSRTM